MRLSTHTTPGRGADVEDTRAGEQAQVGHQRTRANTRLTVTYKCASVRDMTTPKTTSKKAPVKKAAARKPAQNVNKQTAAPPAPRKTGIDFSIGKTGTELIEERATLRSSWAAKLVALRAGVDAGEGQHDTFYRIGSFKSAGGATTALRNIRKRGDIDSTAGLRIETRVLVDAAGNRTSELWAAVTA